mmetsp:Transcript_5273/g.16099  ORF Transcript_5273/g.16099 Transcript_5273/m.16099 type:complete len:992 (+) Transcript_5273:193-3168(+)
MLSRKKKRSGSKIANKDKELEQRSSSSDVPAPQELGVVSGGESFVDLPSAGSVDGGGPVIADGGEGGLSKKEKAARRREEKEREKRERREAKEAKRKEREREKQLSKSKDKGAKEMDFVIQRTDESTASTDELASGGSALDSGSGDGDGAGQSGFVAQGYDESQGDAEAAAAASYAESPSSYAADVAYAESASYGAEGTYDEGASYGVEGAYSDGSYAEGAYGEADGGYGEAEAVYHVEASSFAAHGEGEREVHAEGGYGYEGGYAEGEGETGEGERFSQDGLGGAASTSHAIMESRPDDTPEQKRQNIVKEIQHTERNYVASLLEMVEHYQNPLLALADGSGGKIRRDDILLIFSNVQQLVMCNQELLKGIDERVNSWSSEQLIGDVFFKMGPFLRMYTAYGAGYQKGLDTYNRYLKESPKFAEALTTCKNATPSKMSLEHLLIMPVQRIPRYNLLLQDLIKRTPEEHADYPHLNNALQLLLGVADQVNEHVKQAQNIEKLLSQSSKGTGFKGMLKAHRHLEMESFMTVEPLNETDQFFGGKDKKSKGLGRMRSALSRKKSQQGSPEEYQMILFNDMLVMAPKALVKKQKDIEKMNEFNWPLNLVWVLDHPKPNLFVVVGPNRGFIVHCPDAVVYAKWHGELSRLASEAIAQSDPSCTFDGDTRFGRFEFFDHTVYEGWWKQGRMEGHGTYTVENVVYEGEFVDNLKCGHGKLVYSNGDTYEGAFDRGLPNGTGLLTTASGDTLKGSFENGLPHGNGSVRFKNGDALDGGFAEALLSGACNLKLHVNEAGVQMMYVGECREGAFHGKGSLSTMGTRTMSYQGEWKKGVRHGRGIADYGNGQRYEGDYKEDKFHGQGTFKSDVSGTWYQGQFVNGKREGKGSWKSAAQETYEGKWRDDHVHKGTMSYPSGESYKGSWKHDHFHGHGVHTLPNGVKYEGSFELGVKTDKFEMTLPKGKISAHCKRDRISFHDGPLTYYYDAPPRVPSFHIEF